MNLVWTDLDMHYVSLLLAVIYSFFMLLLLNACATAVGTSRTSGVRVITQKQAAECPYLGDAHGISPFYGIFAAPALASAREAALFKAAEMGGDSLIWRANETGYGSTSILADVSKCE
jgi:hypothetical protein